MMKISQVSETCEICCYPLPSPYHFPHQTR